MTQTPDGVESRSPTPPVQTRPVSMGSVHLNALRGGAAMLVFLNHTRAMYFSSAADSSLVHAATFARRDELHIGSQVALPAAGNTSLRLPFGFEGGVKLASEAVVIFFVLSGYLVGGSVLRSFRLGRWSWRDYLVKRLTRLWVPLIPCLLLCVCLDRIGYRVFGPGSIYYDPPGIDLRTSWDLIHHLSARVYFGNIFFLQGILMSHLGTDVSLWSLANEFWYYLAFPCAVLAISPQRTVVVRVVYGVLAIAVLVFTGMAIAVLFPIWVFGAAVAVLPGMVDQNLARRLSVCALCALLICMYEARFSTLNSVVTEYLIALVASGFLYLLVQQKRVARNTVYKRVADYFSNVSYTLYIVHLPIAIFVASSVNSPWHQWSKTPRNLLLFLALDGVVLACATVLWRLFEANTDRIRTLVFERSPIQVPACDGTIRTCKP